MSLLLLLRSSEVSSPAGSGGAWGTGEWGIGPWGGVGDAPVGAPTVYGVASPAGPAPSGVGVLVDVLGGDVITVIGINFEDPMTVEVLSGDAATGYVVEGSCYIFDPRYDVSSSRIFCGSPALPQGVYHVRVTNSEDVSSVIENALAYEPFASELKCERARVSYARVWAKGRRLLGGG